MNEVRMKNKEAGRLCGNCRYASGTTIHSRIACNHPVIAKQPGEASWFRKQAGGCKLWESQEGNLVLEPCNCGCSVRLEFNDRGVAVVHDDCDHDCASKARYFGAPFADNRPHFDTIKSVVDAWNRVRSLTDCDALTNEMNDKEDN